MREQDINWNKGKEERTKENLKMFTGYYHGKHHEGTPPKFEKPKLEEKVLYRYQPTLEEREEFNKKLDLLMFL